MLRMLRLLPVLLLAAFFAALAQTQPASENSSFSARVAHLKKQDGFLPYYWDEKKGEILFALSPAALDREFLYFTGLGSGIGSTRMSADRSSFGGQGLCRFRRVGPRVLLIKENTSFRASKGSPDLQRSVELSFPTSVLGALPIEAEQNGTLLVNATPLFLHDAVDMLSMLRAPVAVNGAPAADLGSSWRVDEERSVIDLESSGSFPLNTEVEALLTFTSDSNSYWNQPEPHVITLREHHSFLALPAPGFEPRECDPRVGIGGEVFQDFSQPFDQPLTRCLAARWRLQKKDHNAALSEPVKPITFYLDRAIPEPVRSAARQGTLWWNQAFEQAGFKDAIRVEDLPEGASPMDVRYPTIQWTNRSGRGWSVGQTHDDPRTGEILHAGVQLDSHRMRTAGNYWQASVPSGKNAEPALDSFAALDNLDPQTSAEKVMTIRLALLTCHEVGHILGLDHNFLASTYGRGSVMDYFAPRIRLRADGSADLSDAYMQGVGSYDRFAIAWGYSQRKPNTTPEQEKARLNAIVQGSIAKGIVWGDYNDPRWNSYDDGPDPVTWLEEVLPVRDALLKNYGPQMLRPGEPNSLLTARFPLVYLFHRYALDAAINVIGGAKIPLSVAGDGQPPIVLWPAESQKQAVSLVLAALRPAELEVPATLWEHLGPVGNAAPNPESFTSSASYLFSPEDGARAVAGIVAGGLLDAQRLQRLAIISRQAANAPSPESVIAELVDAGFSAPASTPSQKALRDVVRTEIAERLMNLAVDGGATPEVRSLALAGVKLVQSAVGNAESDAAMQRLAHEIELFLQNPAQNTPKLRPTPAPPGPPV
ncbi:MAG: zinc-dependent metalloprotease [Acidobacteria bacterium]|nr:zinc-dependent metalloprotease [Acidobacteriota bacterium]